MNSNMIHAFYWTNSIKLEAFDELWNLYQWQMIWIRIKWGRHNHKYCESNYSNTFWSAKSVLKKQFRDGRFFNYIYNFVALRACTFGEKITLHIFFIEIPCSVLPKFQYISYSETLLEHLKFSPDFKTLGTIGEKSSLPYFFKFFLGTQNCISYTFRFPGRCSKVLNAL